MRSWFVKWERRLLVCSGEWLLNPLTWRVLGKLFLAGCSSAVHFGLGGDCSRAGSESEIHLRRAGPCRIRSLHSCFVTFLGFCQLVVFKTIASLDFYCEVDSEE